MAALPVIQHDKREWILGNVLRAPAKMQAVRRYGAFPQTPMVDPSEWSAALRSMANLDPFLTYVHDQGQVGQCNAEAITGAVETQRNEQGTLPAGIVLSAADLYGQINGGVDQGSTLQDGMAAITTVGVGTKATVGTTIWQPGLPPAPAAERKLYRVTEAYLCPSFEECMSAVIAGYKLISGIPWFASYQPDASGWLNPPLPLESPVGGHAIYGYAPAVRANGEWGIWHRNSWTASFGVGGSFVLGEQNYLQAGALGGWWAVREVVDTGGNVPAPAKV